MAQRGKRQETSVWAALDTQRQAQAEPGRRGAARLGGSGSERGKQSMKRDRRETGSTGIRDEESDGSKTKSMAMPP